MEAETFGNVFDALTESRSEAASLEARAGLLLSIRDHVATWDRTEAQVADQLGVDAARLIDLRQGNVARFTLEELIGIAAAADLAVEIHVREIA